VNPGHKKQVVEAAVKDGVCSGRAGCRILGLSRSGYWYRAGKRSARQEQLVKRIHALTDENPRYGYRQIAALLRREGWNVGKRQVRRLCRLEGLRVPPTRRKIPCRGHSTGLPTKATHRNHVWTWDFIADATVRGGALRMLSVLDEHTRECHVLKADRALKSGDVIDLVKGAIAQHGAPSTSVPIMVPSLSPRNSSAG
jgi:putative transposase